MGPHPRPWIALCLLAPCAAAQGLADEPPPSSPLWEELLGLRARVDELEAGGRSQSGASGGVDLSGEEWSSVRPNTEHVLSRPWYENFELHGYAAFTYLDSGGTGTTPESTFVVREASLFLEARVWEHAALFSELWLTRYLYGSGIILGEIHLHLSNLFADRLEQPLGLKLGRFELPFGEDYLRWDSHETPLINFSAADPFGLDEGLELYGRAGPVGWIAAITNGADGSSADDSQSKSGVLKLHGQPLPDLYLSGSALFTGDTASSAFRLGGSTLTPVGASGSSSLGASPSSEVSSLCWELDARIAERRRASLALQFGQAAIDDEVDTFDRDLIWYQVMPSVRLRDDLDLVVRYSAIGTFEDDQGYRFSGKHVADAQTFGYDTSSLTRLAGGLRWTLNPHLALKGEVGHDWLDLIDSSALDTDNDERLFFGLEIVGSF